MSRHVWWKNKKNQANVKNFLDRDWFFGKLECFKGTGDYDHSNLRLEPASGILNKIRPTNR